MDEFKIGDIVKIKDNEAIYSLYDEWLILNCPQYLCNFIFGIGYLPMERSFGKIVYIAPHSNGSTIMLYGIIIKDQIFIIGENGLSYCHDYEVELL